MFKKSFRQVKTSAPLRNSDRRQLRDRIVKEFCPNHPDKGEQLVPEGVVSQKFVTSAGIPGIAYSAPGGDPLWFTLGKDSEDLIPTVYLLWKQPTLIPHMIVPQHVIPILKNGADLMIAGVVQILGEPGAGQLVYISTVTTGPALAVGRMLVDGKTIGSHSQTKGKAVANVHFFEDSLWAMGSKSNPPENLSIPSQSDVQSEEVSTVDNVRVGPEGDDNAPPLILEPSSKETPVRNADGTPGEDEEPRFSMSAEEVSLALKEALLQVIKTSNDSSLAFPIPASTFYSAHMLPARNIRAIHSDTPVDIKHSTYKSLGAFLKQFEKQSVLKLKDARGEITVLSVNDGADDVVFHQVHSTVGDYEETSKRKKEREEKLQAIDEAKARQIVVEEFWKPHLTSAKIFEEAKLDTSAMYTLTDLKTVLNTYIQSHDLVNVADQSLINTDTDLTLRDALWPQTGKKPPSVPAFLKRDKLTSALLSKMQPWHRIQYGSSEPLIKKGQLEPIKIAVKQRQGKKQCTFVSGYEPFMLSSEHLAEVFRTRCASATSVSPLQGASKGEEVMVQGKQVKIVSEFLEKTGVPNKWIKIV